MATSNRTFYADGSQSFGALFNLQQQTQFIVDSYDSTTLCHVGISRQVILKLLTNDIQPYNAL